MQKASTNKDKNSFHNKNKNLILYSTVNGEYWNTYHFAKRFNDGSKIENYFAQKVKEVFEGYNFDGVQISDCATFTQARLLNGDFSDDLVEQFIERTGISLPYSIKTTTVKQQQARFRYIISNLRYEWSVFISERYGEFVSKIIDTAHSLKKLVTLVNAYTCSPFEAMFRYGIDYRKYSNADKWMFEDAVAVGISGWQNNEMVIDDETRWNWIYRLMEKQGALKLCTPNMKIINMTNTQDTNEQWNLIDNAPNEFKTDIAKSNAVFYWEKGKLKPTMEGYLFCLSDGIDKYTWSKIHKFIDDYKIEEPIDSLGFTALYDDDLKAQLKEFISTRRHNAGYFNYEFLLAGLPITARASKDELALSRGPLLICAEAIRDEKVSNYLEKTDRLMIVAGYSDKLKRKADCEFLNGDLIIKIYNTSLKIKKSYEGYKKTSLNYYDDRSCHWPKLPRMDKINRKMLAEIVGAILKSDNLPYGVKPHDLDKICGKPLYPASYTKGDYKIFTYKISDKHYKMLITNVENFYVHPLIKFPYEIENMSRANEIYWSKPKMREGFIFTRVHNRSSELIDIYIK